MRKILFISTIFSLLFVFACNNKPAGEKATTGDAARKMESAAKQYSVNSSTSNVQWEGAKATGIHSGSIGITSGSISVDGGKIQAGTFTIDMGSIINTDLEAGKGKEKLEGHLKSPDFFDVAQFPTGTFELTKVSDLEGDAAATHLIYGNLTLKGVTKEIGFKATVDMGSNGISVTSPSFTIDRTDWNIKYGSDKFFDDLKDKAIKDEIGLIINLNAA